MAFVASIRPRLAVVATTSIGPQKAAAGIEIRNARHSLAELGGKGAVTVKCSTEAAVGAAICRSGRISGRRCGTIEAKNHTVSYSSGEGILNLARTTACSEGGDSGGSFITGPGQAQGVLSGGSGSCKGKQPNNRARSHYQPLLPIVQAYTLTLRTDP